MRVVLCTLCLRLLLLSRISKIREFDDVVCAYVTKINKELKWSFIDGQRRGFALSREVNGPALKVLFLGLIRSTYLVHPSGGSPDYINIRVMPLDDGDRVHSNQLLGQYSVPESTFIL